MVTSLSTLPSAIQVFYSYAHEDEDLRTELNKHLILLQRQGVIVGWHDRRITAGTKWSGEIDAHLQRAQIILLLVSADFLASDYCYEVELQRAMTRHEADEARVIPIILRAVDWSSAPFGLLQALPQDGRPITSWSNRDEAFHDVARGIRAVAEEITHHSNLEGTSVASKGTLYDASTERSLGSYRHALLQHAINRKWWDQAIPIHACCGEAQETSNARDILGHWLESRQQHCIILGAPGAGKTGLMWWMASRLAELENAITLVVSVARLRRFDKPTLAGLAELAEPPLGLPFGPNEIRGKQLFLLLDGLDELVGAEVGGDSGASQVLAKVLEVLPASSRVVVASRTPAFALLGKNFEAMLPNREAWADSLDPYEAAISRALGFRQRALILRIQPVSATDARLFLSNSDLPEHLVQSATTSDTIRPFLSTPFSVQLLTRALPSLADRGSITVAELYRTYVDAALFREDPALSRHEIDDIVAELRRTSIDLRVSMSLRSEHLARRAGLISGTEDHHGFSHYSLWEYFFGSALFEQLLLCDSMLLSRLDLVSGYNINRMLVPMIVHALNNRAESVNSSMRIVSTEEYQRFRHSTGWRATSGYGLHPSMTRAGDGTPSATFAIGGTEAQAIHNDTRHGKEVASAVSWYDAAVFAMNARVRLPTSEQLQALNIHGNYLFWSMDWHDEQIAHICALDTQTGEIVGINPDVRLPRTGFVVCS
jgi:hypothetical protein